MKIVAASEYVKAYQNCYVEDKALLKIADEICEYINNYHSECYLEFGKKECDYTPAFCMRILPTDKSGHMKIEVDIEIVDNDKHLHRCLFYVESELGLVETLGNELKSLVFADEGTEISLYTQ